MMVKEDVRLLHTLSYSRSMTYHRLITLESAGICVKLTLTDKDWELDSFKNYEIC